MPKSREFLAALEENGYSFFAGVPCSLLKGVIRRFDAEPKWGYVSATREDSALGMAAGAWMAGRKPAVFMQNSGLGVSLNALASLHAIYRIPTLVVVTWRGQGGHDAPEHIVMGAIMEPYFSMLEMPWRVLTKERVADDVRAITAEVDDRGVPGALVVPEGVLDASA
jgi:phosphonopyruvate decarboxylase